jgi:hypothetical protein
MSKKKETANYAANEDRPYTHKGVASFEVIVMARADGYAMVRRKGLMPFIAREKFLFPTGRTNRVPL